MSNQWPSPFQPVSPPPPPPPPPAPAAESSRGIKLVVGGLAAALLVVVGLIAAYVFVGGGPAPTATPTQVAAASTPPATATPSPTAESTFTSSPATSTAPPTNTQAPATTPTATANSDEAAQVQAVMQQVPQIRELDALRDTPFQIVSRDQFRQDLAELLETQGDPDLLAAQQRLWQRLGLLPDDADLQQMFIDLNGSGALAYYRFDTQTMYVIENGTPFDAAERFYVSHEYTHALQDQHFQVGANRITDTSEGDAAMAQLSVAEGDASVVMSLWASQYLTLAEQIQVGLEAFGSTDQELLASMPPILQRQLSFPYAEGLTFANSLKQSGGWAAVNEALQVPPPSTEQILHPEKYTAHEAPIDVALADPTADLGGGGWQQTYIDTFGEVNMQMFVAGADQPDIVIPGLPVDWPHAEVAAGWGGDRIAMWERDESGSWAIAWRTAWDTKPDADEFAARATALQSTLDGVSKVVRISDTEVLLLMASAEPTLQELESALTK